MHLLVRDEARAGAPSGSAGRVPMRVGGRLRRARRRVALRLVVQLDDLGPREVPWPPRRRTASSAPRRCAKFGAWKHGDAGALALPRRAASRSKPRRPDDDRHAGREARARRSPSTASGRVKSTAARIRPARPRARRRRRARPRQRRREHRTRPCPRRRRARPLTPPCRAAPGSRARPPRGSAPRRARSRPPRAAPARAARRRARRPRSRLDRLDLGHDPLEREQLRVGDQRLPEPAHAVRGRLHREQDPALEVLLRPLELVARARCPPRCRRSARRAISRHSARLSSRVPT